MNRGMPVPPAGDKRIENSLRQHRETYTNVKAFPRGTYDINTRTEVRNLVSEILRRMPEKTKTSVKKLEFLPRISSDSSCLEKSRLNGGVFEWFKDYHQRARDSVIKKWTPKRTALDRQAGFSVWMRPWKIRNSSRTFLAQNRWNTIQGYAISHLHQQKSGQTSTIQMLL
jgi:hypothetical protein